MNNEKVCKRGHKMTGKTGRDGRKHWYCQKCRNAAARKRRARQAGGSGRRTMQSAVASIFGPNLYGDYGRDEEL